MRQQEIAADRRVLLANQLVAETLAEEAERRSLVARGLVYSMGLVLNFAVWSVVLKTGTDGLLS
jgi:hypothetical protein